MGRGSISWQIPLIAWICPVFAHGIVSYLLLLVSFVFSSRFLSGTSTTYWKSLTLMVAHQGMIELTMLNREETTAGMATLQILMTFMKKLTKVELTAGMTTLQILMTFMKKLTG